MDAMVRHLVVVAVRPVPVRLKTCTTCNAQMRCVCDGTVLEPTHEVTGMLLQSADAGIVDLDFTAVARLRATLSLLSSMRLSLRR